METRSLIVYLFDSLVHHVLLLCLFDGLIVSLFVCLLELLTFERLPTASAVLASANFPDSPFFLSGDVSRGRAMFPPRAWFSCSGFVSAEFLSRDGRLPCSVSRPFEHRVLPNFYTSYIVLNSAEPVLQKLSAPDLACKIGIPSLPFFFLLSFIER